MFEDVKEIEKNKFLNNLTELAEMRGLFGCYIRVSSAENPVNNGIYFVSGYEKDVCLNPKNEIDKLYIEQQTSGTFRTDLFAIRITDNSPFAVHQAVHAYTLHASTIKGILNKYDFKYFLQHISPDFMDIVEELYKKSVDPDISFTEKEKYKYQLGEFLRTEGIEQYKSEAIPFVLEVLPAVPAEDEPLPEVESPGLLSS